MTPADPTISDRTPPSPHPTGSERRRVWVDGVLRPWSEVTVHVLSQSIQRGSLVFDVLPVYASARGTAILGLREHVERFLGSAELTGMTLSQDLETLVAGISEAVRANPTSDIVKICAYYPGVSLDILPVDPRPTVAIAAVLRSEIHPRAKPYAELPPARLRIAETRKLPAAVLSPQAKIAASYTAAAVAKQKARAQGFDDALFLDEDEHLTESSTQSFFAVADGVIHTAPLDTVLGGITRRVVLEIAEHEGLPLCIEPLAFELARIAEEAFLTSTTAGIWPVGQIDAYPLPRPIPGPITSRLVARFERMVAGEDEVLSPRWMQKV